MTRRTQTIRTRTAWGVVAGATLVAALTGCSSSSGARAAGTIGPSEAASLAAAGNPSAAPSAAGTASGGATPTASKGTSYLEQSAKGACKPDVFRTNAALARGAFEAYVRKPAAGGTLDPVVARRATEYASVHLTAAAAAVKSCRTAKSLHGVTLQTVGLLDETATSLQSGSGQQRVDASTALLADVVAQADRLRLATTPRTPSVDQLG